MAAPRGNLNLNLIKDPSLIKSSSVTPVIVQVVKKHMCLVVTTFGRHRYRTFPSLQKILLDGTELDHVGVNS